MAQNLASISSASRLIPLLREIRENLGHGPERHRLGDFPHHGREHDLRRGSGARLLLVAGMMGVTIYHNPACGTSRNTLAMIRNAGMEPVMLSVVHLVRASRPWYEHA